MKLFIRKSIIFILIFIFVFSILSILFVRKGNGYGTDTTSFYYEPRNSFDLIFFGSSHTYASFNPKVLKEKTGINSYNFSTQQQPLWITYHYMIEALKYQKPKYFVLDVLMVIQKEEYATEGVNRDAIDRMRFSINKINTINVSVPKEERASYYINFIKYHSRWKDLNRADIKIFISDKKDDSKGFTALKYQDYETKAPNVQNINDIMLMNDKNKLYLNKIIELANKNNIELIFVKTPYNLDEGAQKVFNSAKIIAKDNNIDFIDYNLLYDEIDLDFSKDMYDKGHVTVEGARKVTEHFSNYLININK